MNVSHKTTTFTLAAALAVVVFSFTGYSSIATGQEAPLTLSGAQEVPAVSTSASGTSMISVSPDRSVSGSVTTSGLAATMAHVHNAAMGQNGPVIIPLTKSGDNTWVVPPGTKLTDAQYESFKAGNLYVNVHSAAYPGGEVRAQLMPGKMEMMGSPARHNRTPIAGGISAIGVGGKPMETTTNFGTR